MTEESKERQIMPTIKCGNTECGECELAERPACPYVSTYTLEDEVAIGWTKGKRFPQCLADEAKAVEALLALQNSQAMQEGAKR